jgi:hypothetical protein
MPAASKTEQGANTRRGSVTKQYRPVSVLSGFMDDPHFRGFAQEQLLALSPAKQKTLLTKVDATRTHARSLPPLDDYSAEIRPLEPKCCSHFSKDKTFTAAFGQVSHRFAWIRVERLVAIQVYVMSQAENVPSSDADLVEFALPRKWGVPAELSFIPPFGPIYIVSSSPHLVGLNIQMDNKNSRITLEPTPHINLVQVVQFGGRYFLRNGYHRVVGALSSGVAELPALVVDGSQHTDVVLPQLGQAGFGVHSMSLPRPPLVSDFAGAATVEMEMRERRYGASVSLQISPFNIGI